MTDQLFDGYPDPEPPPDTGMGQTARTTARRRDQLARGWHPATAMSLADNGKHCGDCAQLWLKNWGNGTAWKCLVAARLGNDGPDMVKSWPACRAYQPRESDDAEP